MEVPSEFSLELVEAVSKHIDAERYKEAIQILNDNKYAAALKNNGSDLIRTILERIDDNTSLTKPTLLYTSEKLLSMITEKSNTDDVLLELIEQAETANNDAQFIMVLAPIKDVLVKLTIKRGYKLEWCLNTITSYVTALPQPNNDILEGDQRMLLDSDPNVRRIVKIYSQLPSFYQPFIEEFIKNREYARPRNNLIAFLVGLLGKPLIFIDLEYDGKTKSDARICIENLICDICSLEKNILKMLNYVEIKCNSSKQHLNSISEDMSEDVFLSSENLTTASLGGLLYILFAEDFPLPSYLIPQVYSQHYIFAKGILPALHLLNYSEYGPVSKGLKLVKSLIQKLAPLESYRFLESSIHKDLCEKLARIAVYSDAKQLRKDSVEIINVYINRFDWQGKYILIKTFMNVSHSSGLIGYIITLFKNLLKDALSSDETFPDYLTGNKLLGILKEMCSLPQGVESDLVSLADQIISALNLLRFILIRDVDNKTNIKEHYNVLEKYFLDPLREGLNLSKAHYKAKLQDAKDGKKSPNNKMEVNLNVSGTMQADIPLKEMENILNSGLNCLLLIESLLARIGECAAIQKSYNSGKN